MPFAYKKRVKQLTQITVFQTEFTDLFVRDMSFAQQSVLPLSFSVERLLQHSASANHAGSRKPGTGGSLGSASDIESTPPSSPASSCNSIDSKEMQSTTPRFGGQVLLNAPGFTTLPCIPLSAFTWHPSAAALHPSPHQTTPLSYRVSGVGAAVGTPHLTATYPSVNLPLQRQHLQGRLVSEKLVKTTRTAELRGKPKLSVIIMHLLVHIMKHHELCIMYLHYLHVYFSL